MIFRTQFLELDTDAGVFLKVGRREYHLTRDSRSIPAGAARVPLLERFNDGPQGGRLFVGPWCMVHSKMH